MAAADDWDEPMRSMDVAPFEAGQLRERERMLHDTGIPSLILDRHTRARGLEKLLPKLQRFFIGVIYRPKTEMHR